MTARDLIDRLTHESTVYFRTYDVIHDELFGEQDNTLCAALWCVYDSVVTNELQALSLLAQLMDQGVGPSPEDSYDRDETWYDCLGGIIIGALENHLLRTQPHLLALDDQRRARQTERSLA